MAVKKYNPMTPGTRFRVGNAYTEVTTDKPEKSLLAPLKKSGGRNNSGRMTVRQRGRIFSNKTDGQTLDTEIRVYLFLDEGSSDEGIKLFFYISY